MVHNEAYSKEFAYICPFDLQENVLMVQTNIMIFLSAPEMVK